MQKKKQYYEIKDGGVTLYWDMTANVLVDIDVQPGVKTVNLFAEKTASKYLYSTYRVKLENAYKQFPDVEELHIEGDIQQVSIRNDMVCKCHCFHSERFAVFNVIPDFS